MKKAFAILLMTIVMMCLVACGDTTNEQSTEHDHDHDHAHTQTVINLRIGLSAHEGAAEYESAKQFVTEVEARSEGAIKATLYGNGQLGSDLELLDGLNKNDAQVDIVIADVKDLATYAPKIDVSGMPFLFENYEQAQNFMNSDIQKDAASDLVNSNMRALAYYSDGFCCLVVNNMNIDEANDLQGLTFATTDQSMSAIALKTLGARTQQLHMQEARQAMGQGYCDGFQGSLAEIMENRIYQGQKYLIMTNHSYQASGFIISESVWQSLDTQYQEIIEEAALSSSYANLDAIRQQENQSLQEIESAGVHVRYPKMDTFWQKAEAVLRGYSSEYGSITDKAIMWKNEQ